MRTMRLARVGGIAGAVRGRRASGGDLIVRGGAPPEALEGEDLRRILTPDETCRQKLVSQTICSTA